MLKHMLAAANILFAALIFQSCDGGYKKTESGLRYKIHVDSTGGAQVEIGSVAMLHMIYTNEKDTFDTFRQNYGQPIDVLIPESTFLGSLEEGLTMLTEGDSATFLVSSDSLYEKRFKAELPEGVEPGGFTTFHIKIVKVYSKDEVAEERKKYEQMQVERNKQQMEMVEKYVQDMMDSAHVKRQLQKDEVIINQRLKKDNLKAQKTKNSVYYVMKEEAGNAKLQKGDTVSVNYTGRLLNGKVFDSSEGRRPFTLVLGMGQVIPGWEEALLKLGKGDKATIFIPSPMGYGARGIKDPNNPDEYVIPDNSILIFDVEVLG